MDHYLDIQLLPDPEFPQSQLMNALCAKLHRTLANLDSTGIGISFPELHATPTRLGGRLRLHGSAGNLRTLMAQDWLTGMRDHSRTGDIVPVPAECGQLEVRRVQAKSSPERLRRRQMKRKGWSETEAREAIPDSAAEVLHLPYLELQSHSTGQRFRLFISQRPSSRAVTGSFNAYGISTTATVPSF